MPEIVATVGTSSVGQLCEVAHAGDAVHLTGVLAIGFDPIALPGSIAEALEDPATLHRVTHRRGRLLDGRSGLRCHLPPDIRLASEPDDPTSVPVQGLRRGALALHPAQRTGGIHHRLARPRHREIGAPSVLLCAAQHVPRRVFLLAPQVEERRRPEAEGPHTCAYSACSPVSAAGKSTRMSAG
jgi:hypothetical protein